MKVRDYGENMRELTGLVKETYLIGLQLVLSFLKGNLNIIKAQSEQLLAAQREYYTTLTTEVYERLSTEALNFWNDHSKNHLERIINFQKDYSNVVINTSDRFMKEAPPVYGKGCR